MKHFITLTLTRTEAQTLQRRMRLTCMNETGSDSEICCGIERQVSSELARANTYWPEIRTMFADLYPAGGRE